MSTLESVVFNRASRFLDHHGVLTGSRRYSTALCVLGWVATMAIVVGIHEAVDHGLLSEGAGFAAIGLFLAGVAGGAQRMFFRVVEPVNSRREGELARLLATECETVRQLEELRAARREIITQVAHELRTPVTVLTSSTDILVRHCEELSPDRRQALLAAMFRASRRIAELPSLLERIMQPDDPEGLRDQARERGDGQPGHEQLTALAARSGARPPAHRGVPRGSREGAVRVVAGIGELLR